MVRTKTTVDIEEFKKVEDEADLLLKQSQKKKAEIKEEFEHSKEKLWIAARKRLEGYRKKAEAKRIKEAEAEAERIKKEAEKRIKALKAVKIEKYVKKIVEAMGHGKKRTRRTR